MRMEVNKFSTNRLLLSSYPVTLSCSHLVTVSSGVSLRKAYLLETGLFLIRSLMGQSPLLRKAHLLEIGLPLKWSLMGQSPLFLKAHLLEADLSLIRSVMGQSHLLCKF